MRLCNDYKFNSLDTTKTCIIVLPKKVGAFDAVFTAG